MDGSIITVIFYLLIQRIAHQYHLYAMLMCFGSLSVLSVLHIRMDNRGKLGKIFHICP